MRTMDEYKAFLAAVRTNTGLDMLTPDDGGLVSVRVDGTYTLNLQFVEATGKVLCFVEIAELPKDAPKAVYRDLLVELNTLGAVDLIVEAADTGLMYVCVARVVKEKVVKRTGGVGRGNDKLATVRIKVAVLIFHIILL